MEDINGNKIETCQEIGTHKNNILIIQFMIINKNILL